MINENSLELLCAAINDCDNAKMTQTSETLRALLSDLEKYNKTYAENRTILHEQLSELQADFEDLSGDDLIDCRSTILKRINICLEAINETDEDNEV